MLIHHVRTGEQFDEIVVPHEKRDGKPDRGPKGVSSAYPIPKDEHVFGCNSVFLDSLPVRRKSDEVLLEMLLIDGLCEEPGPGREGVRHRFLRRKRF